MLSRFAFSTLSEQPLRIFLCLWSLSTYVHYADRWEYPAVAVALLLASMGLLVIKNLRLACGVYLTISTGLLLYLFPILANHLTFTLFVNFFLIYRLLSNKLTADESLITPLRLGLAVVYLWAAVHKINSDFLTDTFSCAFTYAANINEVYFKSMLPDSVTLSPILPYFIILTELAIGLGLLWRRTVFISLLLSILFHVHLVALEFVDFSLVSLSIFVLLLFSFQPNKSQRKRIAWIVALFVLLEGAAGIFSFYDFQKGSGSDSYWIQALIFAIFALSILFFGFQISFSNKKLLESKTSYNNLIFPALLFIFGGFNYLGLSTSGTFSMFSNIKTEGSEWNHLFIPKSFKLFHYQDKIYWTKSIESSFSMTTPEHIIEGAGTPEIELYRNISIWKKQGQGPRAFKYTLNEVDYSQNNILKAPDFLNSPYSWFEFKLLYFRRVQQPGFHNKCLW